MPTSNFHYEPSPEFQSSVIREDGVESGFIGKLQGLRYEYRTEITNRATLEKNFREKFEAPNSVRLTDAEFVAQAFQQCPKYGTFARIATQAISVAPRGSSRFRALELAWPSTIAEQQRIATCLSSLDALITAETQKHEALKTHKKDLMQQLFPSPEEG
ncbi:MAG: hypothetical protein KDK97_17085 [Verrucomicrobiales bacterium]|nr:hypothetical protein [Verrucomicrobiales bacterium]